SAIRECATQCRGPMKRFDCVLPRQFPVRRHEASDHRFAPVPGDLPCDTDCSFWYRLLCQVPILPVRSLRLFVDVGSFYGSSKRSAILSSTTLLGQSASVILQARLNPHFRRQSL